jgi:hypothetical protein
MMHCWQHAVCKQTLSVVTKAPGSQTWALTVRFSCSQPHMTTRPASSRMTLGAYSTSPKSNLKGPLALSRSNRP